jgi:hypothetical protein
MADQHPFVRACGCPACRRGTAPEVAEYPAVINVVLAGLDERHRRVFAGLLASDRGHGGVTLLAQVTGLSRTTILRGQRALEEGIPRAPGRARRPGGGRPRLEKNRPAS